MDEEKSGGKMDQDVERTNVKRKEQAKANGFAKRPRMGSCESNVSRSEGIAMAGTPNRVAKAKGFGTPSPGRASVALTMLELTHSSSRGESKCTRSLGYECESVKETCRKLHSMFAGFYECVLDPEELYAKGLDDESLPYVLGILQGLFVVVEDDISGLYVWYGCDRVFENVNRIVQAAPATPNLYDHIGLSRFILSRAVQKLASLGSGVSPSWSLQALIDDSNLDKTVSYAIVKDIVDVFAEVGLVKERKANEGESIFSWTFAVQLPGSRGEQNVDLSAYSPIPFYSGSPNSKLLTTPVENSNPKFVSRPTPQSADDLRSTRRLRIASRMEKKNIHRRAADDGGQVSLPKKVEFPKKFALRRGSSSVASVGSLFSRPSLPTHEDLLSSDVNGSEPKSTTKSTFEVTPDKVMDHSPFIGRNHTKRVIANRSTEALLGGGSSPRPSEVTKHQPEISSYLNHPLPSPRMDEGEPVNAAIVTSSFLRHDCKAVDASLSSDSLPSVEDMIKYQVSCFKEFVKNYAAFYKSVHPEWAAFPSSSPANSSTTSATPPESTSESTASTPEICADADMPNIDCPPALNSKHSLSYPISSALEKIPEIASFNIDIASVTEELDNDDKENLVPKRPQNTLNKLTGGFEPRRSDTMESHDLLEKLSSAASFNLRTGQCDSIFSVNALFDENHCDSSSSTTLRTANTQG